MARSKFQTEQECFICHTTRSLEEHHIFGGSNRKNSEQDGLKVYLCRRHHTGNKGVHFQPELMQRLHEMGQREYEKNHTREDFRRRYGRNYLEEE